MNRQGTKEKKEERPRSVREKRQRRGKQ